MEHTDNLFYDVEASLPILSHALQPASICPRISLLGYLYGSSIDCQRINTHLAAGDDNRVHIQGRLSPVTLPQFFFPISICRYSTAYPSTGLIRTD